MRISRFLKERQAPWMLTFISLFRYNLTIAVLLTLKGPFSLTRVTVSLIPYICFVIISSHTSFVLLFRGPALNCSLFSSADFGTPLFLAVTFSPWRLQAGTTRLYLRFKFLTLKKFFVYSSFSTVRDVVALIYRRFEFALKINVFYL